MKIGFLILAALAALYLYCIMPRMFHRPDMAPLRSRYFAHRGLHDIALGIPENSLPAFSRAVEQGFGIELDLHLTKDGIPVVFHDFHLKRMTGEEGDVEDYTLKELKSFHLAGTNEQIPTLSEVLSLVDGKVPLLIEYKTETTDIRVCPVSEEQLKNYRGLYCVESFNPIAMRWYKKHRPDILRGQLSDKMLHYKQFRTAKLFLGALCLQGMVTNVFSRPDFIAFDIKFKNLSRFLDRKLFGSVSAGWTVKSREELSRARHSYDVFIFEDFVPDRSAS
ncbi:MAG: glycerophosphodiester phosphodiesterase family protein [Lachnospiraceae bacterium]